MPSPIRYRTGKRMPHRRRKMLVPPPATAPNPWLPIPTLPPRPSLLAPGTVVILPTAATSPARLTRCLQALRRAADATTRVVLVVCPATGGAAATAERGLTSSGLAGEVLALPGPFNYVRSMNAGLRRWRGEGAALFLNDDAYFVENRALAQLRETLQAHGWAAVGPWLRSTYTRAGESADRTSGACELREPIVGACVLWDCAWLRRLPLDERFGEGYGHDESDLHLRARRLGARWGREDRVLVEHETHATFGPIDFQGELYQRNVALWNSLYPGVGSWGQGAAWEPTPGMQVVIAGHNAGPWLERCFESVEAAMQGQRWVLALYDDASTDHTGSRMTKHQATSTADQVVLGSGEKARNAAQAKNRALQLLAPYRSDYPAVLLMDADDVMLPHRPRLAWEAVRNGRPAVFGDYQLSPSGYVMAARAELQTAESGGLSPCTTCFHASSSPQIASCFARRWMPMRTPTCSSGGRQPASSCSRSLVCWCINTTCGRVR